MYKILMNFCFKLKVNEYYFVKYVYIQFKNSGL